MSNANIGAQKRMNHAIKAAYLFNSLTQLMKKLIKKSEVPNIRFQDLRRTSENRK